MALLLGVKMCGNCNPSIWSVQAAKAIAAGLGAQIVPYDESALQLTISACNSACVEAEYPAAVVIRGLSVNHDICLTQDEVIEKAIKAFKEIIRKDDKLNMNYTLSNEHKLLQKMYREFAENEVKPLAEEIDETERFPTETVEKMAKLGILGIPFPKKYGGMGGDNLAYAMCVEEIAKQCGTTSVIICAHTSLCCYPIYAYGTEEQKMKYLPDLLSGRKLGAFGLTEPNAGSDASGQQTIAVREGDHYVLNGSKCFITNASEASTFVVFAMTDRHAGNHGISAFIVERDFPGFSVGKHEKKMGIRGSATCDLVFEDCIVPAENLLGQEGKGFKIAMGTLDGGRVGVAAQALGIGEGAINEAVKYTKERIQFGKRLSQFQNTQFQLADMQTRADAAQLLVYRAAVAKDANDPMTGYYSSMAKLFAAEMASDVTRRAVQLFGGYGYTREYPVERMMRDAKITEIYEGTSEVQRMVISRAMGVC